MLNLRVGGVTVDVKGMVDAGFGDGGNLEVSVGEMGEVTGVVDAMVPPTPVLKADGMIFNGAFRVMEHAVGGKLVVGEMRAGLCGEPIAMTKGILELDATLNLRSGGDDWVGKLPILDALDPARERGFAGDIGDGELAALSRVSFAIGDDPIRTLDGFELFRSSSGCTIGVS